MQTVICLMGPTASGKTQLALEIVRRLPCDIVSVDSALVYRGMDIGTAKPSAEELAVAPHRLIDLLDPAEAYSAGQFQVDAQREIDSIHAQQRIPLLVGGTMLYFRALQAGLAQLPSADPQIRAELEDCQRQHGLQHLYQRLQSVDPEAAERINSNDPQRIIRALEVHAITGQTLTHLCSINISRQPYDFINIVLMPEDRSWLHQRIEKRFEQMLSQGFVEEVEGLRQRGDLHLQLPSMRAVGYRQVWRYLGGELSYTEMRERGVIATRQLAKRQLTWLRSWQNVLCFNCEDAKLVDRVLTALSTCRTITIEGVPHG